MESLDASENAERRAAPRKRALLTGHVAYGDGAFSLGCTIKDISATGARIAIPVSRTTPLSMMLIDVRDGIVFDAVLKWRTYNEIGLAFRNQYPLKGDLPNDLRFLRRLWNELRAR
jgi:hypothetical protein